MRELGNPNMRLNKVQLLAILVVSLTISNVVFIVLYINAVNNLKQYEESYNKLLKSYEDYRVANLMLRGLLTLELARTNVFLYVSSAYSYILSSNHSALHSLSLKLVNNTKESVNKAIQEIDKILNEIELLRESGTITIKTYFELKHDLTNMRECLKSIQDSLDNGIKNVDDISLTLAKCG